MHSWEKIRDEQFHHISVPAYLNHAGAGPTCVRVACAINNYITAFMEKGSFSWSSGLDVKAKLRKGLGQLMHAPSECFGITHNTSHGLMVVAQEFPWQEGDTIVLVRGEFPANTVTWLMAAKRYRLNVEWLDVNDIILQSSAFHEVMKKKPRLLAVSWVQYQTGQVIAISQLAQLRQEFQVAICVDAIQGIVPLTLDLSQHDIDFVTAGGHKWLLGPEGTGFLYVHPKWKGRMRPEFANWLSQIDPIDFLTRGGNLVNYDKPYRETADRIEFGTSNNLGIAGLAESVQMINELGPETVSQRIRSLAESCWLDLEQAGLSPASKPEAGIVSIPMPSLDPRPIIRSLAKRGVILGSPDGHIRFSAHIHNDTNQLQFAVAELATSLRDK